MTIHQSVKIRAVYEKSLFINYEFNAINKTWALVNKNTQFLNTRNPDLIEAFKFVKITFENASISWRSKMWKTKMKQMLHRLRVSKILNNT